MGNIILGLVVLVVGVVGTMSTNRVFIGAIVVGAIWVFRGIANLASESSPQR